MQGLRQCRVMDAPQCPGAERIGAEERSVEEWSGGHGGVASARLWRLGLGPAKEAAMRGAVLSLSCARGKARPSVNASRALGGLLGWRGLG
jgi:hypothetical protein